MSAAKDGGPAFPSPGVVVPGLDPNAKQQGAYAGMTLRDYFAAKAMQALITDNCLLQLLENLRIDIGLDRDEDGYEARTATPMVLDYHSVSVDDLSGAAYDHADAMLKERAKAPVQLPDPKGDTT